MSLRITSAKAHRRSLDVGFEMVGEYMGSHKKTTFRCPVCDNIFQTMPNAIWTGRTKTCGHCHDPKIGDVFGRLTITNVHPSTWGGCQVTAKCECGQLWRGYFTKLFLGNTRSCGCYRKDDLIARRVDLVGQTFGYLTILEFSHIHPTQQNQVWKCHCKCGQITYVPTGKLRHGDTQSCGCYNREQTSKHKRKNITNKKIGRLVVIRPSYINKTQNVVWKCICKCGNPTYVPTSRLLFGHTQSCGNCQQKRNGQTTSQIALQLDKNVQSLSYVTTHNYTVWQNGHQKIVIDIVIPKHKIAIEYDEWYWHGYKQKKDKLRLRKIRRLGWKTLQIKASQNLPTPEQLEKAITELINGAKQRTITLPGWGTRPTKFPMETV